MEISRQIVFLHVSPVIWQEPIRLTQFSRCAQGAKNPERRTEAQIAVLIDPVVIVERLQFHACKGFHGRMQSEVPRLRFDPGNDA